MKREISRKIKAISDEIGTAAAEDEAERIIEDLETEYDARIAAGMSELDAYRDILANVSEIEELLRSLPKTNAESASASRKADFKSLKKQLDTISTVMWLLAVIGFFMLNKIASAFYPWLIFLYGAILQVIINMVKKYNSGKTLRRTVRGGLSTILWLLCVILFFVLGNFMGSAWLIFLVGAIVQVIINATMKE